MRATRGRRDARLSIPVDVRDRLTRLPSPRSHPSPPPPPIPFSSVALAPRASSRVSAGRSAVLSVVADEKKAICVLTGTAAEGTVTFTQSGDGPTTVVGNISGLAEGLHGFHIHEFGYEEAIFSSRLSRLSSECECTRAVDDGCGSNATD